ncbi:MAG: O-antigen ligase family protein [Terriglobia bacterium]
MAEVLQANSQLTLHASGGERASAQYSTALENSARAAGPFFADARGLILAILFLAPLAFGAVEPWAWGTIGLASMCSFALWAAGSVRRGSLRIVWTPLCSIGILFLVFAGAQYALHLTEDRAGTWEAILKLATDFAIFFLAGQLWGIGTKRPEHHKSRVAWLMAREGDNPNAGRGCLTQLEPQRAQLAGLGLLASVYTFSLALFAILQFFSSHGLIYWRVRPRWGGWVFGPYVNHNHFAGLMEMLIPLAAAFALAQGVALPKNGWIRESDRSLARRIWPLGAVLLGLTSVMLSGSRGGLIALLVEGLLFLVILAARNHLPRRHRILAALSIGAAVLLFLWLAPADIASRLATVARLPQSPEATLGQREAIAGDTLHMFKDHWLTGTGLGSFETAFTPYLTFPSDFTWGHAHNDYLEVLAATGVVGGLLALVALAAFLVAVFRRLRAGPASLDLADSPDWMDHWIRLGAAVGCVGLLVHSLADFNLHIPANAAWFAMLAGLAITGARRVSGV